MRSLDVISCVDKFSKGEEKALTETKPDKQSTHSLGNTSSKRVQISN